VNGLFNATKPVFKFMMRQRSGYILNLTSVGALRALRTAVHSARPRPAVIGFTKCLSREAAPFGITINAIAAGIFDTDLSDALPERLLEKLRLWCSSGRRVHPEE